MKTSFSINVTGIITISIEPSNGDRGGAATNAYDDSGNVLVDVLLKSLVNDAVKKYAGDKGTTVEEEEDDEFHDLSSLMPHRCIGLSSPMPHRLIPSDADDDEDGGEDGEEDGELKDYKKRLIEFYETHNPSKIDTVDSSLVEYKGKEEEMFRKLESKYVVKTTTTTATLQNNEADNEAAELPTVQVDNEYEDTKYQLSQKMDTMSLRRCN